MGSTPIRIDDELLAEAKSIGAIMSRSASMQVQHWARLGRELELSGALDASAIERVLAGRDPYDALTGRDQAVVRAAWDERIADALGGLDLAHEFTEAGRSWTDADDAGAPVPRSGRRSDPARQA